MNERKRSSSWLALAQTNACDDGVLNLTALIAVGSEAGVRQTSPHRAVTRKAANCRVACLIEHSVVARSTPRPAVFQQVVIAVRHFKAVAVDVALVVVGVALGRRRGRIPTATVSNRQVAIVQAMKSPRFRMTA